MAIVSFTKERVTQNEVVYKCTCPNAPPGQKNAGSLQPIVRADPISGSPLQLLLSQAVPGGVTELADLEGSAGFNGSLPIGALDVFITPGSEQQLAGTNDYAQWAVTISVDANGFPAFIINAPSDGGTATVSIICRHSRIE